MLYLAFFVGVVSIIHSIKRNSPLILVFNLVSILLVVFQGLVIKSNIGNNTSIFIRHDNITIDGIFYTDFFVFLYTTLIYLFFLFFGKCNYSFVRKNSFYRSSSYSFLIIYLFLVSVFLLYAVGGITSLIYNVRPTNVSGATFPLLLLLGSNVFYIRNAYVGCFRFIDVVFISLTVVLLFLSGSRMMIILFASPIFFTLCYCGYFKIRIISVVFTIISGFIVGIVFQSIKHYLYIGDISIYNSILYTIDVFYLVQVETYSGVAGVLSYCQENTCDYNLGMSSIDFFVKFIPGSLKSEFDSLFDFFNNTYFYQNTSVPPMLADFFVYFGYFSVVFYTFALCLLVRFEYHVIQTKGIFKFFIFIIMISSCANLVRSSFEGNVFFIISNFLFGFSFLMLEKKFSNLNIYKFIR